MKLPFLLKWPLCKRPNTHSFRVAGEDDKLKTLKSVLSHDVETAESWFTKSSSGEDSPTFSTDQPEDLGGKSLEVEEIVRRVKSERLFFEPAGDARLGSEEDQKASGFPFKESLVIEMESQDPHLDFRTSMKEMVETHNFLRDNSDCLEELLSWYLEANRKVNHGFIVEAFVDLLADIGQNVGSSCTSPYSFSSAVSSFSFSSPQSALAEEENDEEEDN